MANLSRNFGDLVHNDVYIIWLFNRLSISVYDEGYSKNASCALKFISTFLFKHGTYVT